MVKIHLGVVILGIFLAISTYHSWKVDQEFSLACRDWLALQEGYLDADGNTVYWVMAHDEPVISSMRVRSVDQQSPRNPRKPDIELWLTEQKSVFDRIFRNSEQVEEAYRWSWAIEGRIREACAKQLAPPVRRVGYFFY